jgi:arylsulfatase A-like enzyme
VGAWQGNRKESELARCSHVTIDTLRADHLSSYGYPRQTTPVLDGLARNGVRFANAYSTSSWTVPAVSSLLTSLHPESHGVVKAVLVNGEVRSQQILPEHLPRLPELLRANGYRTFGITANGHLDGAFGFAHGFDRYENLGFRATAERIEETLRAMRDEIRDASPYFLWLHYFDPHAPYVQRQPWLARYGSRDPRVIQRVPVQDQAGDYRTLRIEPDSPELEHLLARYDAEISYTDQAVGRALRLLDAGAETMIIVTADHGEEFLDHGSFGHMGTLYDELIRVPLIVRLPGRRFAGEVVEQRVSIVDVAPSVLAWLDLLAPAAMQGEILVDPVHGPRARSDRAITSSLERRDRLRLRSIIPDDWKLIRSEAPTRLELLFDLASDPGETRSLVHARRAELLKLDARLHGLLAEYELAAEPEVIELSDERLEEVRSLGYLQ